MAYDIFISYRRKGAGAGVAGELQSKLENLGFKVFLDVDKIGSGEFPDQIKHAIEECKDFLLVLSPGTLDRCVDEEDWVRREILMAQEFGKNIIGVGLPGFIMPEAEALPAALQFLATKQVFVWTHEYRAASFEKIAENLISSKLKKKRNRQKLIILAPVVLALIVAGVLLLPKNEPVDAEKVSEVTEQVSFNVDSQLRFNTHVNNVMKLTQNMPDAVDAGEIKILLNQSALDSISLNQLMESIAECEEALSLKEEYGDQIVDTYGVEAKKKKLLDLRQSYFDAIMADLKIWLDEGEGGARFARQDLKSARIIALPEEKDELDSLDAIIN